MMPVYVNEGRTAGLERWSQIHQEVGNVNEVRSLIEKVISDLYQAIDNLRYAIQRLEERA